MSYNRTAMKLNFMTIRIKLFFLLLVITAVVSAAAAYPENRFKLKAGADGEICLKCHKNFEAKLKEQFVHTPVSTGKCSGCHNPHTSSHGKLLYTADKNLCGSCHKNMVPDNSRSSHQLVIEGNCVRCHDPHASANKYVLLKEGNKLCFECHSVMADKISTVRFKHKPAGEDCLSCHNPHASAGLSLLKDEVPSLCIKCHRTDNPSFTRQHMNYPVAKSRCTSCHDSHGSNMAGIMLDEVHAPVSKKQCGQCHEASDSQSPLATKKKGADLCTGCHKEIVDAALRKNRVHWPMLDSNGCLNCHAAHASGQKKLLDGTVVEVCGRCHADTVRLQKISIINPKNTKLCKPVREGDCIKCHSPHSSDSVLLLSAQPAGPEGCGKCHEWQKHSAHPSGEKVIDPRNINLSVDCMSCHRACGTGNKPSMSQFETITETCIHCHKELERR